MKLAAIVLLLILDPNDPRRDQNVREIEDRYCFFSCVDAGIWITKFDISEWLRVVTKLPKLPIPKGLR